ncbi:MAG: hypothetical protein ABIM99_03210 [Candidatus Dojkabacteria bacterium]
METVIDRDDQIRILENNTLRPFASQVATNIFINPSLVQIRPYLSAKMVAMLSGEARFNTVILNEPDIQEAFNLERANALTMGDKKVIKITVSRILEVLPEEARSLEVIKLIVNSAIETLERFGGRGALQTEV